DVSCSGGHGVLLGSVGSLAVAVYLSACSMRTASALRHVRPILPTFFCHPYSVYMRPNGFGHAHLIFCTPHRHTGGAAMTFEEILDQAIAMLQRRGRVTYCMLQRQFQLDDDTLADLLAELRYAHQEAISEDEQGMVWTGGAAVLPTPPPPALQS